MLKRVASLCLLTACASDPVRPGSALQLDLALSASVIHPGERVPVSLNATNNGRESLALRLGPCAAALEISRNDHVIASGETAACPAIAVEPMSLAPGETHTYHLELQWPNSQEAASALAIPGEYQVRGIVLTGGDRLATSPRTVTLIGQ